MMAGPARPTMTRRGALSRLAAGAGALALGALGCRRPPATGICPTLAGRRIRWIVPNAAGGGYDTESRLLQPFLEQQLGAEIVVENIPGAGGLLGARAIAEAPPDGLTLGIAGMPGLLVASLTGQPAAPDPVRAFTVLGRISRSEHVWAVGASSPLGHIDDVIEAGRRRPLVFAINEIGSTNVVSISVASALLGVQAELVAGFSGTRAATLAAARGDVDLVCFDFDTIRSLIEAGELRPVLQLSMAHLADDPVLDAVPLLGGTEGLAARAAVAAGDDPERARQLSAALARLIGCGRVIVAPGRMDPSLTGCLSEAVARSLTDDELRARTSRSLQVADGAQARADVEAAAGEAAALLPIIEPALARLRG